MMHEPDCPLFNQTIEGEGRKRKKTLIRVVTDQLPRARKQFENEKNALKISDEKVISGSAINQHMKEAKKKPEKKEKKKLETKSQKERERERERG